MEKIGNIYGAANTVEEIVEMFKDEKAFQDAIDSGNNLAVRVYLSGRGYNRVTRSFAAAVLAV